ncbi:MAG: addiction module toxin RelE [archaeon]
MTGSREQIRDLDQFTFDLSDHLRETLGKLAKKDRKRALILNKKIREIISSPSGIDHYKNLRHDLSDYKRVHIDSNFVLFFRVFRREKHILFERLEHHDRIYRK